MRRLQKKNSGGRKQNKRGTLGNFYNKKKNDINPNITGTDGTEDDDLNVEFVENSDQSLKSNLCKIFFFNFL